MKLFHLVSSVLTLPLVGAYLASPPGAAAPGTTTDCSEWVQQSYALTCAIIEEFFGMTTAQFEAWNPSAAELGANCTLIPDLYYCVQINFSTMSTLVTGPPTSTASSSSTATSTFIPTTTSTSSLSSSIRPTSRSKSSTSTSTTSTTSTNSSSCTAIAIASPTTSGSICGLQADSVATKERVCLLHILLGVLMLQASSLVARNV